MTGRSEETKLHREIQRVHQVVEDAKGLYAKAGREEDYFTYMDGRRYISTCDNVAQQWIKNNGMTTGCTQLFEDQRKLLQKDCRDRDEFFDQDYRRLRENIYQLEKREQKLLQEKHILEDRQERRGK